MPAKKIGLIFFFSFYFLVSTLIHPVFASSGRAQPTFIFSGRVIDAQTKQPLANASLGVIVVLDNTTFSASTDSLGRYELKIKVARTFLNPFRGRFFYAQISAFRDGYLPKIGLFYRLKPSQSPYNLDIQLEPIQPPDTTPVDKTPPKIIITSPEDGSTVNEASIQLTGTIDDVAFSENRALSEGLNTLTKTATDAAGNSASASITVYLNSSCAFIGPEGGEVVSNSGKVKLVIPQGALSKSTCISISDLNNAKYQPLIPKDTTLLNIVECKPYGLIFSKPVQIVYTLDSAQVPGTAVKLGIYDNGKISFTSDPAIVPADGYTLTFTIWHFSTYAALRDFISQGSPIGTGVKIPLPDLLTGALSHSVALTIPPGRKGVQPNLSLNYRSGNSNSWIGVGYSLNPGYIVRSTRLGPAKYIDNQDTFYLITDAGTTELVNLVDNLYQAKVESSFTKYYKEADDSWRVVSKDGSVLRLGQTSDSKEISSFGTFAWYLTKAIDTNGNFVKYNYAKDQGKPYLSRIDYTGNENGGSPANSVEFSLESRDDVTSSYISGSKSATAKRLKEIQVKAGNGLVWRYVLEYNYSPDTNRSLLKSVTQYGSDDKSLPTQKFAYQSAK